MTPYVHLGFSTAADKAGLTLDSEIASGGNNLSVGQHQIIALARAIVRVDGKNLVWLIQKWSILKEKRLALKEKRLMLKEKRLIFMEKWLIMILKNRLTRWYCCVCY